MKVLKFVGILLAVVLVAALIGMFVMPGEVKIARSITIKAPKEIVWSNVKYATNFPKWSPWHKKDPAMKVTYFGTDGEVGGGYEWSGNDEVKSGSQKVIKVDDTKRIEHELKFGGFDGVSNTWYELSEADNGEVKVTWGMLSQMPKPYNLFGAMMRKSIEKDYDQGLASLKTLCEKEAAENPVAKAVSTLEVKEMDMKAMSFIAVRKKMSADQLSAFFADNFPKQYALVAKTGHNPGPPAGIYYTWDEKTKTTDVAAAVECAKDMKAPAGMQRIDLKGGKSLYIDYYGNYQGSESAHYAIDNYLKEHKLDAAMPCMEQYITDPEKEKDTAKWHTRVVYFLK